MLRIAAMNLMLHGIGSQENEPIEVMDSLAADRGERFNIVLTNPPFGKKSSFTVVGQEGEVSKERETYERDDFWATTSNKQLNFVQHVKTLLKVHGRAAVVVPDNVLFEGGACGCSQQTGPLPPWGSQLRVPRAARRLLWPR